MLESMKGKLALELIKWSGPPGSIVKINFDGAYDGCHYKSASGIVARNAEGIALLSYSETRKEVPSAFAAKAVACRKAVQIDNRQIQQYYVQIYSEISKWFSPYTNNRISVEVGGVLPVKERPWVCREAKRLLTGCENQIEIGQERGKVKGKYHIAVEKCFFFEEQAFLRIETEMGNTKNSDWATLRCFYGSRLFCLFDFC
ncbi:hypothetical protein GOBAR_AA09445 [Gossypium barbadense]|uniref:RNase H type-1 domain-containing protein n=1 Tax=Gossypium barbadense TaxID=3634 RepID=A0A2P5Y6J1_GOSBA|nr:hypothetical protein GOBAR_AA09445 [Gossypium barbadense]